MKKFIILLLIVATLFVSCDQLVLPSMPDKNESINTDPSTNDQSKSSSTTEELTKKPTEKTTEETTEEPTEEPMEAPTEEPTEAPTEEPTEAPTEEPTEKSAEEQAIKIKALNDSYQNLMAEITTKYDQLIINYSSLISDCENTIFNYEQSKERDITTLQNRITQLKKERDDAYAKAVVQSGGYENSYAKSIKDSYNTKIEELQQQKTNITNDYNDQILSYKELLKQLKNELSKIPQLKANELKKLDTWYENELNKIYSH